MEALGVVGSIVVGFAGLVVAVLAHLRAGKAHEHAESANKIAASAVAIAEESNRIAEDANEISRDAHEIVGTQAAQQTEQWLVDWSINWDADDGAVVLVNTGRDVAHRVTVIVRGKDFHEVCGDSPDVTGGKDTSFPLTQIGEIRAAYARNPRMSFMAGDYVAYAPFKKKVAVTVHWFTGLGQPREKKLDLVLE